VTGEPGMRRIMDTVMGGMDLDRLEQFCASARANGADGADQVRARVTVRGALRAVFIDVPIEESPGFAGGPAASVPPPAGPPESMPREDA
jgi:hypothetical protein